MNFFRKTKTKKKPLIEEKIEKSKPKIFLFLNLLNSKI